MPKDRSAPSAPQRPVPTSTSRGPVIHTGPALVAFALCFLGGVGVMWGVDARKNGASATAEPAVSKAAPWSDDDSPVPVSSDDPLWGSRTAPVTLVEFSDFECQYCGKVVPTIEQLKAAYGPDKLRVIWKNRPLPIHERARGAAEASAGVFALAGSDGFWKFYDTAFKNQDSLSPAYYESWAQSAGADLVKFKAGMLAHTWADKVAKDDAIGKAAGITGTPVAIINGVSVTGAQPYEQFKAVVDQELQKAQAKIASGTPKDRVYVVMSKENKLKEAPAPKTEQEHKDDTTTVFKVPVGSSPVKGAPTAQVTIIEFSDFQCPYCSKVEPTLKELQEKYGDKVRFVWKNEPLPMHPRAEPAAEVALEARAEKHDKGFWDVHDRLFASQPKLDDADLERIAIDAGLNIDKVRDAMKSHKYQALIDADADLADDMQATGTPHFFINGRRLVGAQGVDGFSEIIDDELTKTSALLAKGVLPSALYDTVIKDGKGPDRKAMVIPPNAPSRGNPHAKVTIIEFSDFECPYCRKSEDAVNQVMKTYGDRIHFIWRNLPLAMHPDAPLAAEAAMEAFRQKGSDGFWRMHDLLYANQPSVHPGGLKREALDGYALQLGLDPNKWTAALDSQSHKPEVDADAKAGNDVGITGTPTFLINGYSISGALPFESFKKVIERALAEAR